MLSKALGDEGCTSDMAISARASAFFGGVINNNDNNFIQKVFERLSQIK